MQKRNGKKGYKTQMDFHFFGFLSKAQWPQTHTDTHTQAHTQARTHARTHALLVHSSCDMN